MEGILRAVDAVFPEQSPTTQPADASVSSGDRSDTCSALARQGISPLPWAVGQSDTKYAVCEESAIELELLEHPVCVISMLDKLDERDIANAAYIVKCANAYPRLVEHLRRILSAVQGNEQLSGCEEFYRGYNGGLRTCKEIAYAALKEAGEL